VQLGARLFGSRAGGDGIVHQIDRSAARVAEVLVGRLDVGGALLHLFFQIGAVPFNSRSFSSRSTVEPTRSASAR